MIGRRLAAAVAIASLAIATPHAGAAPARTAGATADDGPGLRLVDQTPFVVPGIATTAETGLRITIGGSLLSPSPCNSTDDVLRIIAYHPVATRKEANAALLRPGSEVSDVEFRACEITPQPDGTVRLAVATTPTEPDPAATEPTLRLPQEGVIPIGVELVRGSRVERLVTFVDRLATGTDASTTVKGPMRVAVAVNVDGGPTLQPDGTVQVAQADQDAVAALIDLLEEVGNVPLSVSVRPELLEGLSTAGSALVPDLKEALGTETDVLAVPYVGMDPTAAAGAGLGDTFATQLALGDQVLSRELGRAPSRGMWFVPQTISTDGAQVLSNAAVRMVALLPPAAFGYSPSDRQFLIPLQPGSLAATPVDPEIAAALADPGPDPTLAAFHLAAQVLLTRTEALHPDQGYAPIEDHNMILTTPDGTLGDPTTTATLIALLAQTPQLSLVSASTIGAIAHPIMTDDGPPYEEPAPGAPVADLTAVRDALVAANADVDATASMLPPGDPRPATWRSLNNVMPSAALNEQQRAAYVDAVAAATLAVRSAVVPPASRHFTLGGRHATLRLSLRNDGDTDLTVRLTVDSAKLEIEDPDRLLELPAGQTEEIEIPVEARTNGEFPVDVRITTPEGDLAVTEPVVMTARVNALTGLGQLATGAFLLVLLTWWVHHIRQRRRRATAEAVTP